MSSNKKVLIENKLETGEINRTQAGKQLISESSRRSRSQMKEKYVVSQNLKIGLRGINNTGIYKFLLGGTLKRFIQSQQNV